MWSKLPAGVAKTLQLQDGGVFSVPDTADWLHIDKDQTCLPTWPASLFLLNPGICHPVSLWLHSLLWNLPTFPRRVLYSSGHGGQSPLAILTPMTALTRGKHHCISHLRLKGQVYCFNLFATGNLPFEWKTLSNKFTNQMVMGKLFPGGFLGLEQSWSCVGQQVLPRLGSELSALVGQKGKPFSS